MIRITQKGSFVKIENFLKNSSKKIPHVLEKYGEKGVFALSQATPKDTGETANSWKYEIIESRNGYSINWYNTNMAGNTPVVILIQYGHGTKGGRFIPGKDFINPAIKPIFDAIAENAWKEVANT